MVERVPKDDAPQLSERIEKYRKEVHFLIRQGGEQPSFEFKRSASPTRVNLEERFGFIKLLQGLANAEIDGERCLVIGADPKEKCFFPVGNTDEFDSAKISQILNTYLHPLPNFSVFPLTSDNAEPFILIVFDAIQPRPIFVIKEGHTENGKECLREGDIWIKKNTSLVRALRADIDLMYETKIETEAEDRARKRLKHLQEISPISAHAQSSASRPPDFALLAGPKNDLRSFAEELIAANDLRRFRMLVELAREPLVSGWDSLSIRGGDAPADLSQFVKEIVSFFRDQFLPTLQSIVELAVLGIKYEIDINSWHSPLIELLVETFDASRGLNWLKTQQAIQQPDTVRWWQPALEVFLAVRTIAIYAVSRKRPTYLGDILAKCVTPVTIDDRFVKKTPILFWPVHYEFGREELVQGRSSYFWKIRIGSSWGKLFGTLSKFLEDSCQLEFLLELNSYFGANIIKNAQLGNFLSSELPDVSFDYRPDLYSQDLQSTVPAAELVYDILSSKEPFPRHLAVDARIFDKALGHLQPSQRLLIYGGFLSYLEEWQGDFRLRALHRHPFFYRWQGRLAKLVLDYDKDQQKEPG